MSLPHLLTEIGPYFESLGMPNFCVGPTMTVSSSGMTNRVIFDSKSIPDCAVFLIPVLFTKSGQYAPDFVEGYNFLLINRLQRQIERINPLSPHLESLSPTALVEAGFGGYSYLPLRPEQLPQGFGDRYTPALYYLESRIMNPEATREQVLQGIQGVTPPALSAYRDRLLSFIPPPGPNMQRGLIFCSGQLSVRELPAYLPQGVNWTTLDTNLQSQPDIFGSYSSFPTLQQVGLFSWDYVYVRGCPVGVSATDYQNIIRSARWLLKRGGQVYIPNHYGRQPIADVNPKIEARLQRERADEQTRELERIRQEELFSQYQSLPGKMVVFTA